MFERGELLLVPYPFTDLISGQLPVRSWIRTDRIVTLNASLIVKSIGHIAERLTARAVEQFCARIGYPVARK